MTGSHTWSAWSGFLNMHWTGRHVLEYDMQVCMLPGKLHAKYKRTKRHHTIPGHWSGQARQDPRYKPRVTPYSAMV